MNQRVLQHGGSAAESSVTYGHAAIVHCQSACLQAGRVFMQMRVHNNGAGVLSVPYAYRAVCHVSVTDNIIRPPAFRAM